MIAIARLGLQFLNRLNLQTLDAAAHDEGAGQLDGNVGQVRNLVFHQSGELDYERGISRAGNRHMRGIAIDLAWLWLRHQPHSELTLWFNRRFACGSPRLRKIGIVALARKLTIALWRYADFGEIPKGALLKSDAA